MTNARAVRYRRLALAEPDVGKARTLNLIADEAERGVLCVPMKSAQSTTLLTSNQNEKNA